MDFKRGDNGQRYQYQYQQRNMNENQDFHGTQSFGQNFVGQNY